jgi:hypothetical protein
LIFNIAELASSRTAFVFAMATALSLSSGIPVYAFFAADAARTERPTTDAVSFLALSSTFTASLK